MPIVLERTGSPSSVPGGSTELDHEPSRFVEEGQHVSLLRVGVEVARMYGAARERSFQVERRGQVARGVLWRVERLVWRPRAQLAILQGASIQSLLGPLVAAPISSVLPIYHPAPGLRHAQLFEVQEISAGMSIFEVTELSRNVLTAGK